MGEVQPREIRRYVSGNGRVPFAIWLDSLRDRTARAKIKARLDRVKLGNFGNVESVGAGVFELQIDYGPGYRVYFGQVDSIVLLLWGGNKDTQEQDIQKAKVYWTTYEQLDKQSGSANQ